MREWKYCIDLSDIWDDEGALLDLKRFSGRIAERIMESTAHEEVSTQDMQDTLWELAESTTEGEFDACWSAIYDWADDNAVWIELHDPTVYQRIASKDFKRLLTELKGP